jgi:hypothetical protein
MTNGIAMGSGVAAGQNLEDWTVLEKSRRSARIQG